MEGYGLVSLVALIAAMQLIPLIIAECPLDMSGSNFTKVASLCSSKDERGQCCRYINAFVALSISRYANGTSNLGVPGALTNTCLTSISQTLALYGVPRNATAFCGFGSKIPVNYECMGRSTVEQMVQSPEFDVVADHCKGPLSEGSNCRVCLNAGISYLRHLVGPENNLTMSTCRDATFVALTSRADNASAVDIANCFFGVDLGVSPGPSPPSVSPKASPMQVAADSPNQDLRAESLNRRRHSYHLSLILGLGIAVTAVAITMVLILIILIRRKSKELNDCENTDHASSKAFPPPHSILKLQEGPSSMFRKFSYKEIKKATENFNIVIGQGGFGTVYKASFSDGSVAAVKRMNKTSEQGDDEFCSEIKLLARLHHRHLVSLRGFCIDKNERFLMYEYMENGSLKDHLHSPSKTPLSWQTRIQVAIDVANALVNSRMEYLHFYCDPPLCHRDIKSSNILLDENLVAKIADFGLAHASKDGSVSFEPVNTDVRGTPGYMDPEYVITQELTEKSDIYSYGVVLLELITARRAVQDGKNLIEWSQIHSISESRLASLVDPNIRNSFDPEQLQIIASIVRWCTQKEGWGRPTIKQVLRMLYESSDPMDCGLAEAIENEEYDGNEGRPRTSKGKIHRNEFHSGDARCLASSSSTSRSYCSRSFLLENGSPQSPPNILSV